MRSEVLRAELLRFPKEALVLYIVEQLPHPTLVKQLEKMTIDIELEAIEKEAKELLSKIDACTKDDSVQARFDFLEHHKAFSSNMDKHDRLLKQRFAL